MARYGAVKKGIKRYGKAAGRYAKKAAVQRYMNSKGNIAYGKIIRDVKYLKSVLNPEKKKNQINITDAAVGQCSVNNNSYWVQDITPVMAQSATSTGRNGNSIKVHSSFLKFQLQAQSSVNGSPIRFRIMVVKVVGTPISIANVVPSMFSANTFITSGGVNAGIIDYNSDRREDTFKQFIILRSKIVSIKPNQHTGQTSLVNSSMGIKYKSYHVKFTNDVNNNVSDGQLALIVLADNGNTGATASTLVGTVSTTALSGANLQADMTHWYYDN